MRQIKSPHSVRFGSKADALKGPATITALISSRALSPTTWPTTPPSCGDEAPERLVSRFFLIVGRRVGLGSAAIYYFFAAMDYTDREFFMGMFGKRIIVAHPADQLYGIRDVINLWFLPEFWWISQSGAVLRSYRLRAPPRGLGRSLTDPCPKTAIIRPAKPNSPAIAPVAIPTRPANND